MIELLRAKEQIISPTSLDAAAIQLNPTPDRKLIQFYQGEEKDNQEPA
jgi:hypothetical protein